MDRAAGAHHPQFVRRPASICVQCRIVKQRCPEPRDWQSSIIRSCHHMSHRHHSAGMHICLDRMCALKPSTVDARSRYQCGQYLRLGAMVKTPVKKTGRRKKKCTWKELHDAYSRATSTRRGIQCHACHARLPTWKQLFHHLQRQHGVKCKEARGSYLYLQYRSSTAVATKQVSDEERAAVACVKDDSKFQCRLCHKDLHKISAVRHFVSKHQMNEATVKTWVVNTDGRCLRNSRPWKMQLRKCMQPEGGSPGRSEGTIFQCMLPERS